MLADDAVAIKDKATGVLIAGLAFMERHFVGTLCRFGLAHEE
jgi:hypothetical protein